MFLKSAMGLSDVEWNEDQFEENSWPQFEHDSRHDEFGSIPIWFYIFGGIIATIVICIFIFVIFILCYTLIKGNRNLWFQQPFRGRFGQPTPMYSCKFYSAHLIMFICVIACLSYFDCCAWFDMTRIHRYERAQVQIWYRFTTFCFFVFT